MVEFGVAVPTATEGMMYPVPYATAADAVGLAVAAEKLGYGSVWANDHLTTQTYVREEFDQPPNFFDPLSYLAFVAARTEKIRIATCILVLPFRHPVVAAKQLATIDHLSGGRLVVGVGIGAYREELEAVFPDRQIHRGRYVEEAVGALRSLFTDRRASFDGRWIRFDDVESYPKPLQERLHLLSGGNSQGSRDRAGRLLDGWLPACLTPPEVEEGLASIRRGAEESGRALPPDFEVALQVGVSVAPSREEAIDRFERSQLCAHMRSLSRSTLQGRTEDLVDRNLIGSPAEIIEKIRAYVDAGVTTFAGLLFACDTISETHALMRTFRDEVMIPLREEQTA